jgi:S-adenosylmethionine:tRNA ribosyltransferase-isomerase
MKLSDFDYELPKEQIAFYPPKDRSSAKMLFADRHSGKISHHTFRDITSFLKKGDVLVLNNTKVLPARLFGQKQTGGRVEILLLEEKDGNAWKVLLRPGGRVKKGAILSLGDNGTRLEAQVLDDPHSDTGERAVQFNGTSVPEKLRKVGHMPLPPYIDRLDDEADRERYQTVFAEKEGAVASPTAGLHFDEALLETLKQQGIEIVFVTLHVGYGTFQPLVEEKLEDHRIHEEMFEVTEAAAESINRAMSEGRRIIACGTTSVRTLESAIDISSSSLSPGERVRVRAQKSRTRLFVYPPYSFKVVQGMITNFHLPKTSLLCLVSAFMGHENLKKAYQAAIANDYYFYSYGDAMLIL